MTRADTGAGSDVADLTDPDLLERGLPLAELGRLRRTAPVQWIEQGAGSQFGDRGYWAISRHADVTAVFPDTRQWSSQRNGAIIRLPDAVGPDQAGLLQYLVSFRNHNEFHEQCVERIYQDIWTRCKPAQLSVYARYTRRGGLDISPWRSSHPQKPPAHVRTARQ